MILWLVFFAAYCAIHFSASADSQKQPSAADDAGKEGRMTNE